MDRNEIVLASKNKLSGILTADRYFRGIEGCFDGGFCPTKLFDSESAEVWVKELAAAESKLVYTDPDMEIKDLSVDGNGLALTPGAIMDFDAILTSTRKDRDGDVLESMGVEIDQNMPLLWQHIPMQPIGKLVAVTSKNRDNVHGRMAIANTELGRDASVLVEMRALRISHGFEPIEYEPLEKGNGRWHITKFNMLEVSLVSIPSNVDAVITAFSRHKLHAPLIKGWAQKQFENRPVQGIGVGALTVNEVRQISSETVVKAACSCQKEKSVKVGKAHIAVEVDVRPVLHDPQDTLRWNPELSKAFDTNLEYLEASKLEYEWVSRYLGCDVKQIFQNETNIPTARIGSFLSGLKTVSPDSFTEDVRNMTRDGKERPPVYEVIQLNSVKSQDFLIDGIQFVKSPNGRYVIKLEPNWNGILMTVYTDLGHRSLNRQIIDDSWVWAKENNFLKGEAFALSGEFLSRTSETFSDVFLTEKNTVALERMLKQLNTKGVDCANRGMILMGPPGTGKTLSGRIIKNEADATFIWISARDFWYMGSYGGITYAFDLAKELAPSVLFFEDVDNWIGGSSVDLLKTEMDGIGRSSGVITLLTTNFPERFPEALIDRPGRFHDVLKFDLPSVEERKRMLAKWLPNMAIDIDLVNRTEGLSGAHLYELAAFAKTIQEQDEIPLPDAVTKALDKIAEQRELITEAQLSGSHYRPRKEFVKALSLKDGGEMCTCPKCGHKGSADGFKHSEEPDLHASYDYAAHKCIAEAASNERSARVLLNRLQWELKNIEAEKESAVFAELLA